jgi:hypothetical protein
MPGMQTLHTKVSKPVVPHYGVALGKEGNKGTVAARAIR